MTTNKTLMERRVAAIPRGIGHLHGVFADRAENSEIWDVEGRRFIDFAAGIAVLNTGHRNAAVMARVTEQLQRFTHTCFNVAPYELYIELAERLNSLTPGAEQKKTMLVSTGAEAIENAVKIARAHTGRPGVIAFQGGFHGRTLLTAGLTGKIDPYKRGFGPFPAGIFHARFPSTLHGISVDDALQSVRQIFKCDIEAEQVAAVIVEPVQGEGGFNPAPVEFLRGLRAICDEYGIVLIIDEIQTGFARTGKMFATEYAGIEPDIMTLAKSLAGGFPLAAVVGKAAIMDAPTAGGLGGTYSGNPLACAAALGVLDAIEAGNLVARANEIGQQIRTRLERLKLGNNAIAEVRGLGAMMAMELCENGDPKRPNAAMTTALLAKARERGLLLLSCGMSGNVVRLLVPLTITDALLDEGLDILESAMSDLTALAA